YDSNALYAQELPRAIALYEQALAHDSTFALADAALGTAHMNLFWFAPDRTEARLAAAKAAADRALRLEPDLGDAHVALALWHYWGHRDYDGAQEELERARASIPNSAEVEQFLAAIQRRRGQWRLSIASHRKAVLLDPRRSDILDQLALSYQSLRRYAEADTIYARAMALARDPTDDQVARAWNTFIWKGDLQPVRSALARLQPGSDRYRAAVSGREYVQWLDRDFDAAIRTTRSDTAADWADPNNIVLPRELQLGWAYQAAGQTDAAREVYAAVRARMRTELARRPDVPDLHLGLAFAEAGLGMKDEAVRDGRRAAEMMPPGRDAVTGPGYLCYLAQVYVRVGRKEPALQLLRRLVDLPAGGIVSPAILRTDPVWDPIRDEPGFRALLADRRPVPIAGADAAEAP
ncbi:MAG TPA: tetratricopeptide repeat protein, partial [Gemmatimonadota bacterium]|nr:tetratricopeptide repeat protein [Gemmatimonadota bacterium]